MLKKISWFFGISLLLNTNLFAAPEFNWTLFQNDLKEEMRRFEGAWSAENHWKKLGCHGAYHVRADGAATLKDLKFDILENSAKITATVSDAHFNLSGDYRGASTLCRTVDVGFLIRAYDIVFVAEIFQAGTEEKPEIRVVVRSSLIGRIVLGKKVPDWVNHLVTSWVNRGLAYVWESSIGEKINKLLSKNVNRYLPGI